VSWENDRARLNNTFVPEYIKIWASGLPPAIVLDTKAPEFTSGSFPLSLDTFLPAIAQPEAFPGKSVPILMLTHN